MVVFRQFRRLVDAIQALVDSLNQFNEIQQGLGPALERLEGLERSRVHFEAECEGMLLKADGKLKAANSAEQRERQLKKSNDKLRDPFDAASEEGTEPATVFPDHVADGEGEGVPSLRLDLATNSKTHAQRAKFGLS